jgi:hypothetical protein
MQIKITLIFYLTAVRIPTMKNTNTTKCWQGCRGKRNPHTLLVEMQGRTTDMKNSMDLPYNLVIPLLEIYLKECEWGYYKGTSTLMFISSLFTMAKLPTTDKLIKKMWHLYRREFYLATKKVKFCHFQVNGWMWRRSSEGKLIRFRRPKARYSL